jgi:hypothetical protein
VKRPPKLPLHRLFRLVNGGTPTADPVNWDGEVPWATPTDLARCNGSVIETTDRTLTPTGLQSGSRTVRGGSLIVSTRAPIGYVVQTAADMAFNQGCKGLEPQPGVHADYFRYQLLSMTAELNAAGQGSTFVELSSDALGATMVHVPEATEQRAIADFLDAETARIDALIAKKCQVRVLVRQRWTAVVAREVGVPLPGREGPMLRRAVHSYVGGSWGDDQGTAEHDALCVRGSDFDMASLSVNLVSAPVRSYTAEELRRRVLRDEDVIIEKSGGGDAQPVGRAVSWRGTRAAVPTNFAARISGTTALAVGVMRRPRGAGVRGLSGRA